MFNCFPKQQVLVSFKLKDFAEDNLTFEENSEKFSKRVENALGKEKLIIKSNFSFSGSIFKRLALQSWENKGLFGKGLSCCAEEL